MADSFNRASTEVAVTIPEIWSSKIYPKLYSELHVANLVNNEYEGDIKAKGDKVHIISLPDEISATSVTEGTAVDAVAATYESQALDIDQWYATHVAVSNLAQIQSSVNLMEGYSFLMGRALAKQIDTDLITVIKAGVSAAAPDHIIAGTGAAGIFNPLDDILSAKDLLDAQDLPEDGRWMLMNPEDYNKILALSNVQSSDYYRGGQPLLDGKIPPIYGFQPYKTTQMTTGEVLFGHPQCCTLAIQKAVSFNTYDMRAQGIHADRMVADVLWGRKVLDGKRVVLLNSTGA